MTLHETLEPACLIRLSPPIYTTSPDLVAQHWRLQRRQFQFAPLPITSEFQCFTKSSRPESGVEYRRWTLELASKLLLKGQGSMNRT